MPGGICRSSVCEMAVTCAIGHLDLDARLEEDLDDADAGERLRLDVLDVVDGGRQIARSTAW